jgi:hypothetical protein
MGQKVRICMKEINHSQQTVSSVKTSHAWKQGFGPQDEVLLISYSDLVPGTLQTPI